MLNHTEIYQPSQHRQTTIRQRFDFSGRILSTLLPKCPVSLAAWIVIFAAIVSFSTAPSLTTFLIVGYVAIQFYFMYRIGLRLYRTLLRHPQQKLS